MTLSGVDTTGMTAPIATRTITVACPDDLPADEVGLMRIRKAAPGEMLFTWTDLPTNPDDYVVVSATAPDATFAGLEAAPTGTVGLTRSWPAENTFYRVQARYAPGCLGP